MEIFLPMQVRTPLPNYIEESAYQVHTEEIVAFQEMK
jgi:hypothetical protein